MSPEINQQRARLSTRGSVRRDARAFQGVVEGLRARAMERSLEGDTYVRVASVRDERRRYDARATHRSRVRRYAKGVRLWVRHLMRRTDLSRARVSAVCWSLPSQNVSRSRRAVRRLPAARDSIHSAYRSNIVPRSHSPEGRTAET